MLSKIPGTGLQSQSRTIIKQPNKVTIAKIKQNNDPTNSTGSEAIKLNTLAHISFRNSSRYEQIKLDSSASFLNKQNNKPYTVVESKDSLDRTIANIHNDKGVVARTSSGMQDILDIKFITGKFGLSAIMIPKDPEFKNLRILAIEGSSLKTPTSFLEVLEKNNKPAFTGKLIVNTSDTSNPEPTENAFKDFIDNMTESFKSTNIAENNDDFTVLIPAAGKGTRLSDASTLINSTSNTYICKPAMPLPSKINGSNFLLVQDTLANLTQAGVLNRNTNLEIIRESAPMGSASGLITALKANKIDLNKPLIVRFADAFSDIDFSKAIEEFKKKNTGAMLVGLPVGADMLTTLGVFNMKTDTEITGIIEKPGTPENAKPTLILEGKYKDKYIGSVGMYIFSPEVLQWMKRQMDINSENIFKGEKEFDFSTNVLPKIITALDNDEIVNKHNQPLKMLAYIDRFNWNDLGTTKAYLEEMRRAAKGEYNTPNILQDQYSQNVDLQTGVVYLQDSKKDFERFCAKYNINPKGNILVSKAS